MSKKIYDILSYAEKMLQNNCDIIWAYKKSLVIARSAQEGERVITYASDGGIETINTAKKGDVILTKADHDGKAIIDENGNIHYMKMPINLKIANSNLLELLRTSNLMRRGEEHKT